MIYKMLSRYWEIVEKFLVTPCTNQFDTDEDGVKLLTPRYPTLEIARMLANAYISEVEYQIFDTQRDFNDGDIVTANGKTYKIIKSLLVDLQYQGHESFSGITYDKIQRLSCVEFEGKSVEVRDFFPYEIEKI